MMYLNYLAVFMDKAVMDERIGSSHICLFVALYRCWLSKLPATPFPISRRVLMINSKIASTSTYHKCIQELNDFGYIRYEPSFHPREGSKVYFIRQYRSSANSID